ncbi:hypothetical protein AR457_14810 [Streptomyces agglomeratus]|uniref:HTH merR-type domain-containing protein n=1 Tax=Streptomyces agglomeratus TaxID=285458 RepID=A0A1E5P7P3_9ACTN|nr:hypothetical protein [Streptomyces agglomeratus]OEJ25548.1 hypothetical protein AS594_14625 [Streptomyces agglomeratus]OEJ40414.1 hypothetical protein BGK70_21845 [Streptomyces agglomeratus]OEJ45208.1 hypothetical protein AR457_14810 [Streptomyces agglomeratus]OEJ52965.1 hypothetical protein BGK72_21485 [Streptomyces agglomeratus]OEJ60301.1 hypothetical protein BGM19_22190 [Streptomyces agglomeratus]
MSTRRSPLPAPSRAALITGTLAAQEADVAPATIRKWVQLGHLTPAGSRGRAQLYRLEDVFAAERATRRKPRTPRT